MAELFTRKWQSEGRMVGRYVYSPVGYTEDDVRDIVEWARSQPETLLRNLRLAPFRALLDGAKPNAP